MDTAVMPDHLALDDQLCFALHAAARTAVAAQRSALADLGLTYTQYVTLLALWERDGVTVSELGRRLHLDSGTLSPLLKRMAAAGHIERRRGGDDERQVTIHLTTAGRDLQDGIGSVRQCLAERMHMSEEELLTLRELAKRFVDTTGDLEPAP